MGEVVTLQHRREVKKTLNDLLDIPLDCLMFVAIPHGSDENILGVIAEDRIPKDLLIRLLEIQKAGIVEQDGTGTSEGFPNQAA